MNGTIGLRSEEYVLAKANNTAANRGEAAGQHAVGASGTGCVSKPLAAAMGDPGREWLGPTHGRGRPGRTTSSVVRQVTTTPPTARPDAAAAVVDQLRRGAGAQLPAGAVVPARAPAQRIDVPYTFFKQQVESGNVSEVTSRADVIQGTFKAAGDLPARRRPTHQRRPQGFHTVMPHFADPGLETSARPAGGDHQRAAARRAAQLVAERCCSASDRRCC